jgi:MscS family membrane protein
MFLMPMLSSIEIENYVERDRFLYKHTIKVSIDTTPDQLRYILIKGKKMLLDHPMISPDPARIRFPEFGESSLNLQIFAYILTSDFNEYLEVTEDLHLKFMDIIQDSGTMLAVPARINYNEDEGREIDEERRNKAEEQAREWIEKKSVD